MNIPAGFGHGRGVLIDKSGDLQIGFANLQHFSELGRLPDRIGHRAPDAPVNLQWDLNGTAGAYPGNGRDRLGRDWLAAAFLGRTGYADVATAWKHGAKRKDERQRKGVKRCRAKSSSGRNDISIDRQKGCY